jgi:hypothetical protein
MDVPHQGDLVITGSRHAWGEKTLNAQIESRPSAQNRVIDLVWIDDNDKGDHAAHEDCAGGKKTVDPLLPLPPLPPAARLN